MLEKSYMKALPAKLDPFEISFTLTDSLKTQDVSDHYPTLAHIEFNPAEKPTLRLQPASVDKNHHIALNIMMATVFVLLFLLAVVGFYRVWQWRRVLNRPKKKTRDKK